MGLLSRAAGGAMRGLRSAGQYVADNPVETTVALGAANMGVLGAGGMTAIMAGLARDFEAAKASIEAMPDGPRKDRAMELLRSEGPQAVRRALHRGDSAGGYYGGQY